jgi:N-hydroxyarylamine O-acetyltransferase
MRNFNFPKNTYLKRIDHGDTPRLTEEGLAALHRAQAFAIPFENFDIQLGRIISLAPEALVEKLLRRARGGYCFELNGLFLMALKAFGFDARALLARVHLHGKPSGRGHQIVLVELHGRRWIADVGFGHPHLLRPIPLELNRATTHGERQFRLSDAGRFGIMLQTRAGDGWQDLYSFDLGHVFPGDIAYGNHFTSTHPDAFFTNARVAALPREEGAITLYNLTLVERVAHREFTTELPEGPAFMEALRTHFGIELDLPYEALRPLLGCP